MKKNEKVAVFLKIFLIRYDKTEMKALLMYWQIGNVLYFNIIFN